MGDLAGAVGAIAEDAMHVIEVLDKLRPFGAGFGEIAPVIIEEGFFEIAIAEATGAQAIFVVLRDLGWGDES